MFSKLVIVSTLAVTLQASALQLYQPSTNWWWQTGDQVRQGIIKGLTKMLEGCIRADCQHQISASFPRFVHPAVRYAAPVRVQSTSAQTSWAQEVEAMKSGPQMTQ
jgi:hypothetical protein